MTKNLLSFGLFMAVFAAARIPGLVSSDFANFSPAYALLFCGGVYLARATAWWLPLSAMLVTDIALNMFYQARGFSVWEWPMLRYQAFNYAAWAGIILLGKRFKPTDSFKSLLGGGLFGALLFYLLTNTAAWLFNPFQNPEYSKTFLGWLIAVIKGTGGWPDAWQFFRNTMLSGGLFTGIFVAAMKLSTAESAQEKKSPNEEGEEAEEPAGEEAKAEA